MTESEKIRHKLDMTIKNSTYGLATGEKTIKNQLDRMVNNRVYDLYSDKEPEICRNLAMIWGVDRREIAKIIHDFIKNDIGRKLDCINCPKPPIYIGPVKVKTLKERLEEYKMKATSTQNIKNVNGISFSVESNPLERENKMTVVATTDDDIFEFVFEGDYILQSCKAAGLFAGCEKDRKIRELEKDNTLNKETADHWSKEYYELSKKHDKLKKDRNEWYEKYVKMKGELDLLQRKYDLERGANEAQRKFINEYAGKGTEIEFNYAIGDTDEVSYVIVDKKTYDEKPNIELHGKDYTPDELVDMVFELEEKNNGLKNTVKAYKEHIETLWRRIDCLTKERHDLIRENRRLEELKTPTIENFSDEEPTDNVNHPSHYAEGKYECIDVMQDVFGNEATDNFCLCNAFKYIWRAHKKNGLEDVKKAVWYLNKYIEEAEKDGVQKGERV